jgi:DNA repair exonuclease SbcCD nuclease subunit
MKQVNFTLRGLVSSDWHLGSLKSVLGQSASKLLLAEIDKVYRYAVSNGIEHVFVPGDLFDTPVLEADTLIGILSLLIKYQKTGVKTYYIAGNHDFSEKGRTSLDVLKTLTDSEMVKNLYVYTEDTTEEIDGIDITFLPYPSTKSATYLAKKKSCVGHLNFAHVDIAGALNDLGREMSVDDEHNYKHGTTDFTISGHIHRHQLIANKSFLYSGTLYQKSYSEQLPKGFVEFEAGYDDLRVHVKYKLINNTPSFVLSSVKVDDETDFDSLSEHLTINSSTKFRLLVDKGIKLPGDFLLDNKNILKVVGVKDKADLVDYRAKLEEDTTNESLIADPIYGLEGYLKSRGHGKQDIERSVYLVNEALASIDTS